MLSATLDAEHERDALESLELDAVPAPMDVQDSSELIDLIRVVLRHSPAGFRLNLAKQLLTDLLRKQRQRTESERA